MNVDLLETTELENATKKNNGYVKIKKDHDDNGNLIRTAILCIDKDELDNLLSDKGNPLFIDGTAVPNRLHWELTLITLVDQNLNIQPGGLMFSLDSTKSTFDWFMKKLMKILKDHKKNITIITDEDLAISSSIDSFNLLNQNIIKISHIICAWHKTANFEKKLNKCDLDSETKESIKYLWKRICNSPKKSVVDDSIRTILQYNNHKLNHYIEKHVFPLLEKFSRAYISDFTAGYNVSSLAESANSMLKNNLTSAYYTLAEIKDIIRRAYHQKNIVNHEKLNHIKKGGSFLDENFGLVVGPNVEERLISSLLKSFRLVKVKDNCYSDPLFPDEEFLIDYPNCECGKKNYTGLPCSHLIKYCLDNKINPMVHVSERYLECSVSLTEFNDYTDVSGHIFKELSSLNTKKVRLSLKESHEHIKKSYMQARPKEIILPTTPEPNKLQIVRYNNILSYAKDLAKKASRSEETTQKAIEIMKSTAKEISINYNKEQNVSVYDAVAVNTKGRPRKSRIKASFENSIKRKCKVCEKLGYDSNHLTGMCKYYKRLLEIGKEYDNTSDQSKNKCSLCKCHGHSCRNCSSLHRLIEEKMEKSTE